MALRELDRLAGGVGVAVVIEGEAGIGRPGSSRPSVNGHAPALPGSTPHAPHWARPRRTPRWRNSSPRGAVPERGRRAEILPAGRDAARAALAVLAGDPTPAQREGFAALSPAGRQLATEEAIAAFVRSAARERSLVIAVEDLHWSDASSIGALERLLPLSASEPIALSSRRGQRPTPARPLRSTDSHMGTTSSGSDSTRCRPEPIVTWWSRWSARVLPPALFARILDVGAGNPFFIGELVRSLIDAGALVPAEDGGPSRASQRAEVPPTVDRVLLSRVDRLPDEDRDVLTAASVLGRRFATGTLAMILELDPSEALARLARVDLIRPSPPTSRSHTSSYRRPRTGRSSAAAARTPRSCSLRLEVEPGAEERAAILGRHHAGAGNGEEALRWFRIAADRAEEVSALLEAIENLDEAIGISSPDAAADLRLRRGRLRGRTGDHRGARADLDESLRAAVERGDRSLEMRCHDEIGFLVAGAADYRGSVEHLERALALADELGDATGRVSALSRLTITWANRAQLDRAQRSGELALEAASASGDERLLAVALDALKLVALLLGRLADVERYGMSCGGCTLGGTTDGSSSSSIWRPPTHRSRAAGSTRHAGGSTGRSPRTASSTTMGTSR